MILSLTVDYLILLRSLTGKGSWLLLPTTTIQQLGFSVLISLHDRYV